MRYRIRRQSSPVGASRGPVPDAETESYHLGKTKRANFIHFSSRLATTYRLQYHINQNKKAIISL